MHYIKKNKPIKKTISGSVILLFELLGENGSTILKSAELSLMTLDFAAKMLIFSPLSSNAADSSAAAAKADAVDEFALLTEALELDVRLLGALKKRIRNEDAMTISKIKIILNGNNNTIKMVNLILYINYGTFFA